MRHAAVTDSHNTKLGTNLLDKPITADPGARHTQYETHLVLTFAALCNIVQPRGRAEQVAVRVGNRPHDRGQAPTAFLKMRVELCRRAGAVIIQLNGTADHRPRCFACKTRAPLNHRGWFRASFARLATRSREQASLRTLDTAFLIRPHETGRCRERETLAHLSQKMFHRAF